MAMRNYHAEFKTKVVLAVLSREKTPSRIYRIPKLNINQVNWWGSIDRSPKTRSHHSARLAELKC